AGAIQKRVEVPQERNPVSGTGAVEIGRRNDTLFKMALALARDAESQADLLGHIRRINAELANPLPNVEVQRAVRSAWRYKEENRLMVPGIAESSLILPASIAEHAMTTGNLDVAGLMMMVRKYHSEPGKIFALSPVALAEANKIK